jgi:hypothetical protein
MVKANISKFFLLDTLAHLESVFVREGSLRIP